ncbi:MAG: hypothetical protein ACRCXT_01160 [Paraclostridium sp.]
MNKDKVIIRRPKLEEIDKIEEFFEIILTDTFIHFSYSSYTLYYKVGIGL